MLLLLCSLFSSVSVVFWVKTLLLLLFVNGFMGLVFFCLLLLCFCMGFPFQSRVCLYGTSFFPREKENDFQSE